MLDRYYIRPSTVDRIRSSWLGEAIEEYVTWMTQRGYRPSSVTRRVPLLVRFGEFACARGASRLDQLPALVEVFVQERIGHRLRAVKTREAARMLRRDVSVPVLQMLRVVAPDLDIKLTRQDQEPFSSSAPGFFAYLRDERGLRPETIRGYRHHLARFDGYLAGLGVEKLGGLAPALVSGFITTRGQELAPASMKPLCSAVRVFLRFCYREGLVARDLGALVEPPQAYRLAHLPRSVSWEDVQRTLDAVDRRWAMGRRDYSILLLMVTYGLRAREIARLALDDFDWRREQLHVRARKGAHSHIYPLAAIVGASVLDYLKGGRPAVTGRELFWKVRPPPAPMTAGAIASVAGRYLRCAGVKVRRPGSHTLRHSCVQRLVDEGFPLGEIGDYVGHRSSASTEVYTKLDIESLREVALGIGEEVLAP